MKGTEHAKSLVQMREKGTKKLDKFCEMLKQSTGVDEALNHLLNLKQKQANASEAQIANKLAIETGRQGKTLMIFTAVTIIFLPASFMAAFLTIPIADYPHDDKGASAMTLHWASKYIFSISFGISIPLLILAFNFAIFENGVKNRTGPRAATHVLGRFFIRVHQWLMFLLAWIRLLLLHIWYSFLGDKNKWRRRRYRRAGRRALRRRRGIYKPYESAEN
ncbi:uncharacterized protein K444DRAFT_607835 [Hyaloscypha bicolor E]|uniref:Uncharacterized protein n=1 Tax=Hyaloscypha bicolor E TaxID=1095630 RepID=A0A2J6TQH4_9HELO|nr:uncharacterized protein K444DRAFT_607835 [Hyaloscypha bicolor E]PMD65273.1 hypothetical protein K444DRAFT_607835 [Hyaloscypha bicolor E]